MNTGSESFCVTLVVWMTALAAAIVARAFVGDPVDKPSSTPASNDSDANDTSANEAVFSDDIPALLDQPEAPALDESSLESVCLRDLGEVGIPATIGTRAGSRGGDGSLV